MKAIKCCFIQMFTFIRRDKMLFAICLVPLIAGAVFHFGFPVLEKMLTQWLSVPAVLSPYCKLVDLFFSALTPIMFCYIPAMIILEEIDDHIGAYLFITTLGKKGYLTARLGIPAAMAFTVTAVLLPMFKLTDMTLLSIIGLSLTGTLTGLMIALFIVSFSSNKLEGMAVAKLATFTALGMAVPYFVKGQVQYLFGVLPSFWVGKAAFDREPLYMAAAVGLSLVWIGVLMKRFLRKTA